MSTVMLSEMFRINQRFTRSVNLVHDYEDSQGGEGYIVTPLSLAVLQRLIDSLENGRSNRAWSLTGPYGTGKSACCLFISQVLSHKSHPGAQEARTLLQNSAPAQSSYIENQFGNSGLLPILVSGSRRSISTAIMEAIYIAVCRLDGPKKLRGFKRMVGKIWKDCEKGYDPTDDHVVSLFESLINVVTEETENEGVFLVIDELGKFLEYTSFHPDQNDIFLLQRLAELASRSKETPFLFVTVLHQSFESYADYLGADQRAEWSKVQGRFEDIGFFESLDHFLNLVGKAIERTEALDGFSSIISTEVRRALDLNIAPKGTKKKDAQITLEQCAPLHPTTSIVIGPLFRSRLAQNERSLFAFLSSGEPYGFQEFLKNPKFSWTDNGLRPFYRIDQLYDYIFATQGGSLGSLINGKKWMEIEEALHRLPEDATQTDEKVIKSIGMLTILGDKQRIKASPDLIGYALADGTVTKEAFQSSLKKLEKDGLVIFRRHLGAYSLWEGSDIDLESRFKQGYSSLGRVENLSQSLQEHSSLQPYVAKRHLYETGTLRYFTPIIIDEKALDGLDLGFAEQQDGIVLFVLPENIHSPERSLERIRSYSAGLPQPQRTQILFAVPGEIGMAQAALEEILAWEWVSKNTPALEGDRVARKELAAHLAEAYRRFDRLCSIFFDKETAFETCIWSHEGSQIKFESSRQLMVYLSDVFDRVFNKAPVVTNELVNRNKLSSSAASARKALLGKMLEAPNEEGFDIEGFPPEKSMYISIFGSTSLHTKKGKKFVFRVPKRGSSGKANLRPIWNAMDDFLDNAELQKKPLPELYHVLQAPPYGLRKGLLPIFLTAKLMSRTNEIAIYEANTYVAQINAAMIERLLKAPDRFELQLFPVDEARGKILDKLVSLVSNEKRHNQSTLLTALRPLYSFINTLPEYTLQTEKISENAQKIRDILLKGKEPHKVLFEDIPRALDLDSNDLNIEFYFTRLKAALVELQGAYKDMLASCECTLNQVLNMGKSSGLSKSALQKQASYAASYLNDSQLKAFVLRIAESDENERAWLERVLDVVLGKIPSKWRDSDQEAFQVRLGDLARRYHRTLEILVQDNGGQLGQGVGVRLGITTSETGDIGKVLFLNDDIEKQAITLADEIEDFLEAKGLPVEATEAAVAELVLRITKDTDR